MIDIIAMIMLGIMIAMFLLYLFLAFVVPDLDIAEWDE